MKDEKIVNLAYFAGRLLKPFIAIWAPMVVSQQIRREIADPNKIDEPLELGKRIRKHTKSFMECKVHALPDYFAHKAIAYNEQRTENRTNIVYDIQPEIDAKQLGDIVKKMKEEASWMSVIYFEETEHQRRMPQRCVFGDYLVLFASDGTRWCGGKRNNGYIYKKQTPLGCHTQIANISPQLSDYLAEMIMQNGK